MSKAEDYLDGLLDSMEGTNQPEKSDMTISEDIESIVNENENTDSEQSLLDSFEQEFLSGQDTDAFIREFEQELDMADLQHDSKDKSQEENLLFENLDEIVNSAKNLAHDQDDISLEDGSTDVMIDTIGDFSVSDADIPDSSSLQMPETSAMESEDKKHTEEGPDLVDEEQDLMDLLQSEGDFSDIGDMLQADEKNIGLSDEGDSFADFSFDELEQGTAENAAELAQENDVDDGKKRKKNMKQKHAKDENAGFVKRISKILFGDDEEDENQKTEESVKTPVTATPNIEDLSDENLEILQALEGGMQTDETQEATEPEEDPEAKKKRLKEEKKAKAKAEKQAKKEQAKKAKAEKRVKKVKKPKLPKEPDNTPPLPKKPVILIFAMVASFMVFVLLGTNLFGYSSCFERAEKEFELGNYEAAFEEVYGLEVKEDDFYTYDKYRILSYIDGEYNAYQTFMESGIYDMALDSLVRVVGRCDKYAADAETYDCVQEMQKIKEKAVGALGSFGVSEDRARELCAVEDRTEYSKELYDILTAAGFNLD